MGRLRWPHRAQDRGTILAVQYIADADFIADGMAEQIPGMLAGIDPPGMSGDMVHPAAPPSCACGTATARDQSRIPQPTNKPLQSARAIYRWGLAIPGPIPSR